MRAVDLFAGCGGMSLGFQKAGFEIISAFDHWKPAIDTYKENFDHPIFDVDLSSLCAIEQIKAYDPQIIIGGPPCQDFSSAGTRNEDLGRGDLTIDFATIVKEVRPEWFVMENVERITKSTKLKKALKIFKEAGYGITAELLNASYFGVPQARKRFFVIGHIGSGDNFLTSVLTKKRSKNSMTVYDYLGDSLGVECYYRHPRSYARRAIFSIHEPSPTIRGVNRPIPKTYKKHKGDVCDPLDNVRPLTTIERSYLQTFPKSFKFIGSKSELEQLIGNAVPVNLAKHVGKSILKFNESTHAEPEHQLEIEYKN